MVLCKCTGVDSGMASLMMSQKFYGDGFDDVIEPEQWEREELDKLPIKEEEYKSSSVFLSFRRPWHSALEELGSAHFRI